jgi:2,4-dienoyl-CoA reductase-like NADH-dependent reductase (Old Yellow Enzyme family)/thioredoxin reductase
MYHLNASPHFLQGPETFPADAIISFYANVAKSGAAVVTCYQTIPPSTRKELNWDLAHFRIFDLDDPSVENYLSQTADAIHFYDSKACVALLQDSDIEGYDISYVSPHEAPEPIRSLNPKLSEPSSIRPAKEIPVAMIQEIIEDTVRRAKFYQSLGYDMVSIYMGYHRSILARSLCPAFNKRTDRYGGSLENRARFALELFQAIKKACGQDFLIEARISGEDKIGGYTMEDTVKYAKLWEGNLDILQFTGWDITTTEPTAFNSQKKYPVTLRYAQAIKESGVKVITAPGGGFQDLDLSEEYIATGKTDMIAMGRPFFCDPEYGKKAYEGRGEDVVPCIRCMKCHVVSLTGPWFSVCSVNPTIGIAHRIDKMISPPTSSKKVAIIGGGPAGMKAAIVAAERGHKVTLYEKNDFLGGQLRHADFSSFKWPLRDFKDYLIRQVDKAGVEVLLSTEATPEMIQAKGYDVVLVAAGAEPIIPDIPGADGGNVWTPISVYGNEKALGENVVVVGGAQIGVETGMYLAENGHKVTILTRQKELAYDATPIHYIDGFRDAWEKLENFSYITEVTTTGISEGKVTYVDAKGNEKSIQTDSVVVSAGRRPRRDEALKFYGSVDRFFMIGDCNNAVGNVQKCIRSAFATASQL